MFLILWFINVSAIVESWLNKYLQIKGDSRENRFRDCDNLQYVFRGIEKYVPWANKIYFITWGHVPGWLNTDNDKIVIVKHEDFIPKEYLPTFLDEINPLSKNKKPNNDKKDKSNVDEKIDEEEVNQYLTKVENICNNFETLLLNKQYSSKK